MRRRAEPLVDAMARDTPAASSCASQMPVNAMTEPTDRSMPPVTITKVKPTARISRYALSSRSEEMFLGVMKSPRRRISAPMKSRIRMATAARVGRRDARRLMKVWK